ncbi:MAG: hypothetical protein IRY99_21380, partial [Isosphaeraceae bacterium]|nr:hypothetical protein [Isosphaeraceae bacterium]
MDSHTKPRIWTRADSGACLLCVAVSALLAVAPHLAVWARYGTLEYLADDDDVLYLAIARIPYHGENVLRDPFCSREEQVPCLFAWLQFVPLAKLTRLLGLPPILMALVWRALGGVLFGGSLYVLFRRLMAGTRRPVAWALGCSLIGLSDAGFVGGRPLIVNWGFLMQLLGGTVPAGKPDALAQYRVVTPLLNLPFLLLLVAALHPSVRDRRKAVLMGAGLLGLCFLLYFFFWTAAVVALGGYLVSQLVLVWGASRERRAEPLRRAQVAAAVLTGGMLIGAPQVYSNAQTFADVRYRPILERLSRGERVPPQDPARWRYAKNIWAWGKIAIGAAAILVAG